MNHNIIDDVTIFFIPKISNKIYRNIFDIFIFLLEIISCNSFRIYENNSLRYVAP